MGGRYILSHRPLDVMSDDYFYLYGHIHQYSIEAPNAYCVSVEHTNYTPVTLEQILTGNKYIKNLERENNESF
jgi:calcineurin-like phosphoesterase family protein